MSKIALSGNASGTGTFTFAAPNSNSDRTLTLPDASGEVVLTPSLAGMVATFAMNTPPAGWLKANGQAVSRTTYAALFAAIGTTYGSGNGSTTFNVPDLRGEFLRGWDDARGIDSGRAFGSAQTDAFQGHYHNLRTSTGLQVGYDGGGGGGSGNLRADGSPTTPFGEAQEVLTDGTNGTPRTASETRPRNIALLACIKF